MKKQFSFPFAQKMVGENMVCSCCHISVVAGAAWEIRAGHKLHSACARQFEAVEAAGIATAAVLAVIPAEFVKRDLAERLSKVFTVDAARLLVARIIGGLVQQKEALRAALRERYESFVALLQAAVSPIRMAARVSEALL